MSKTQKKLVDNIRERRLQMNMTQECLVERLPILRKFEQKGLISLDSFLNLLSVVGGLDEMVDVLKPKEHNFNTEIRGKAH